MPEGINIDELMREIASILYFHYDKGAATFLANAGYEPTRNGNRLVILGVVLPQPMENEPMHMYTQRLRDALTATQFVS